MLRRSFTMLVAATVAAGLVLGVSAGVAVAKQKPLSKKEFIKVADNLCRQGNELTNEAFNNLPSTATAADAVAAVVPYLQQVFDSIRALPAPSADKKKIKKILDTAEREVKELQKHPEKLTDGTALRKSSKLARAYGFKVCGATN